MERVIIVNAAQDGYEDNVSDLNDLLDEDYRIKQYTVHGETIFMFILTDEPEPVAQPTA